ncbi:MAG: hypothetical protein U1E76_27880 [Planctomycetota bacterium]
MGALFVLALVTIGLQSRVAQLRYQVAHLADRHRLWQEHVQAEQVELDRLALRPGCAMRSGRATRRSGVAVPEVGSRGS